MEAAVRKILLAHWDPLGVSEFPGAEDEYDVQVRALSDWLARGRATFDDVRKYLDDEAYELPNTWDDDQASDKTAKLLIELMQRDD